MSKRICIAAFLIAAALVSASAQSKAASPKDGETAPSPEELVVAFNVLDLQLDPHHSIYSAEAQIFTAVYEGLFS